MSDQRRLTRNADPGSVEVDPRVNEPPSAQVRFAFVGTLFPINPGHYRAIPVDVRRHRFVHNLLRVERRLFHAGHKLLFVHQRAIIIDIDKRVGKQPMQRLSIFVLLCEIPGVLQRK
jgi:hypothetical protein